MLKRLNKLEAEIRELPCGDEKAMKCHIARQIREKICEMEGQKDPFKHEQMIEDLFSKVEKQ